MTSWHGFACCNLTGPSWCAFNTLRPRQNGRHFADDIFKCILLNENVWITIKNSLNVVPKGPINNIPALVQIMAWRRPGDKPLSEPMLVSLPTHICVTRPQWVKYHHRHCHHNRHHIIKMSPRPVLAGMNYTSWWRHQMETFSALSALLEGSPPVTG